ncbi:sigma factor [Risungbinella massiliensis]|uniref:sigma factor n=1 Tax=Risungbinella massiliensis TaxID=1329796 RepID=UPI0005CC7E9A|nr:sigma factor [Risungbinella massiliensis]
MLLEVKQNGQVDEKREDLLHNLEPYVCRIASRICGRSISKQDEEYIITLHALNEAIDRFKVGQSRSFLSFAYMVASARLVDYYRQEKKHNLSLSIESQEEQPQGDYVNKELYQIAVDEFLEKDLQELRREEIIQYQIALSKHGISLSQLPKLTPKHRDSRESLIRFALRICRFREFRQRLYGNQKIPTDLLETVGIHRRTLQRHRQYLIALTVLFSEDLPLLQNYLVISLERKED